MNPAGLSQGLQPNNFFIVMPTISRFYGISIRMYFDDKHAPHFHAVYAEYKALVAIADRRIFAGNLPRHAENLVLDWARAHRAELFANWERARNKQTLLPIEPLD